ncbi:Serine/threonine-protein kinase AtPK1/AtPK6 [Vitis vinifera]|uniref:Serine/threonine-protein kinase AtPK1/AtPK6 n=1 Tax=Vitis vinifera TaxID=29760 RepID=A0A438EYL7_VITVI|nr:Serine/threonine-protein kinase AtPK1/AtPK6 [Vitis vinifera]
MHVCVCVYALLCSYSSLLYSQTNSKLYLIMDFVNGGHLFFHLYRQGIFSEDQARVYIAEIVSAVSHLHKSGHRTSGS